MHTGAHRRLETPCLNRLNIWWHLHSIPQNYSVPNMSWVHPIQLGHTKATLFVLASFANFHMKNLTTMNFNLCMCKWALSRHYHRILAELRLAEHLNVFGECVVFTLSCSLSFLSRFFSEIFSPGLCDLDVIHCTNQQPKALLVSQSLVL